MRTRKHLTKIAATVALVAGAAGVAGVGTFGAYTDTTAAETKVDSGRVDVRMNGFEKGISITKSNMAAGDVVYVPITIERLKDSLPLGGLNVSSAVTGTTGKAACPRAATTPSITASSTRGRAASRISTRSGLRGARASSPARTDPWRVLAPATGGRILGLISPSAANCAA